MTTRVLPDASVACPNGTVPMALAAHAQMEKLKESTQAKLQVRPHLSSCVTLPFPENSCCFQPCAALLSALNAPLLHGTSLLTVVSPLPSPAAARDGGDAALTRRGGAAERDRRGEDRLGRHHVHRPREVCRMQLVTKLEPCRSSCGDRTIQRIGTTGWPIQLIGRLAHLAPRPNME